MARPFFRGGRRVGSSSDTSASGGTEHVSLAPLRCAACGACVSLGQRALARCAYCATETPVPAEYGHLQRAAQSFAQNRELARELYARIGAPPGRMATLIAAGAGGTARVGGRVLLVMSLVGMFTGPFIIVPFMGLFYCLGYPVAKLVRGFYALAGDPIAGPLPALIVILPTLFVAVPAIAIPAIKWRKERELTDVRRDVHASLAANPPERPGGPSLCRSCGGALDVPSGALGVPCTYCKADNLVALPERWVKHVRSNEFRHFLRIDAALDAYREASDRARERGWKTAFVFVVFAVPTIFAFGLLLDACGWAY